MSHFSNIVSRAQQFVSEVLQQGDLAVDLTAGKGSDTLFMAKAVGLTGRVLAFDIQESALVSTTEKLLQAGVSVQRLDAPSLSISKSCVTLIGTSHDRLSEYLDAEPMGVNANLGYLPGGDETITTRSSSTVTALQQSCEKLAAGGRIAVVVYPGHPGGKEEGAAVDQLFASLPLKQWQVLRIEVPNGNSSPYLLVAEKR